MRFPWSHTCHLTQNATSELPFSFAYTSAVRPSRSSSDGSPPRSTCRVPSGLARVAALRAAAAIAHRGKAVVLKALAYQKLDSRQMALMRCRHERGPAKHVPRVGIEPAPVTAAAV